MLFFLVWRVPLGSFYLLWVPVGLAGPGRSRSPGWPPCKRGGERSGGFLEQDSLGSFPSLPPFQKGTTQTAVPFVLALGVGAAV